MENEIRDALGAMYREEADSEKTVRRITRNVSKEKLADFVVDAFNRGWISNFNLGLNDDGNAI